MSPRTFLVTGATGQQGGATVDALLARGHRARAMTRSPASKAARTLAARGVEVIAGDLENTASLVLALDGVDGAFLVTSFRGAGGVEGEERRGKNFVDAAVQARLPHLVFSSVGGAERGSGIPHFESKWRIEEHARARGGLMTVLRPVFFMENFGGPWLLQAMFVGSLRTVLGEHKPLQMIATRDIGIIAADFLDEGPASAGTALEIAGDALTLPRMKDVHRAITGKTLPGFPMPRVLLRAMPEEMGRMLFWFGEHGFQADLDAVRRRYPGILSFESWLRKRGAESPASKPIAAPPGAMAIPQVE